MTDESTHQPDDEGLAKQRRANLAAEQALTYMAVVDDVYRGAWIGAMMGALAAISDVTPLQLVANIASQMPSDEEWVTMKPNVELKVRNARRLLKGATITWLPLGNQG